MTVTSDPEKTLFFRANTSFFLLAPRDVRGVFYASVAERPNAAMGGTVGGAACCVSSVRVRPEAPFLFEKT